MNLNARRCWLVAGLAVGVMGSSVVAQVAPPPTQSTKEDTKYEPPVKEVAPAQPAAKPMPVQKPAINRPAQTTRASLPTSTPYPKLLAKDENGKIIRLIELPDILAMRSNPTIGQRTVEAIMPVLFGRRARFERLVIDSLDLYWMVTDGRIEKLELEDIKNMSQIAEMIKPLVGRTTLSQELRNRNILTRTQSGMNEHIVNEYKQGVTTEIQFESEDPLSDMLRFVLQDSIHETQLAYRAMLAEMSIQVADLISEAGLTSSEAAELAKLQRPLNMNKQEQIAELLNFDQVIRTLSIDEGITLFTAMRNKRKNPDISPAIRTINVMHDRKIDMSNSDMMQGTVQLQDGRVIDTVKARDAYNEKIKKDSEAFEKEKEEKTENPDG